MRLNIGGGNTKIEGFINVDRIHGQEAYPLPFEPRSVDEIRCCHMLEHLSFGEALEALKDWVRVLKPNARLRLSVPDLRKIVELMGVDAEWQFYIMGGQTDENNFHRSVWVRETLTAFMKEACLYRVREWTTDNRDSSNLPISLNLEGFKMPDGKALDDTQEIKICAVIGIPRLGWNDHWGCVVDALKPWGMGIKRHTGAFWGHNMQTCLEDCIAEGVDWVLTLDYDTMFTSEHVSRLLEIMGDRPDIDAVAGLQTRRGMQCPLMTNGETEIEVTGDPIPANTAHFGLTLIRLDRLKDIPKPWMWDQPSKSGSWRDDDRVDEDIYFWLKWKEHGRTLYIAPDVRIGHLEVMVSHLDEQYQFKQQHVYDWIKENRREN